MLFTARVATCAACASGQRQRKSTHAGQRRVLSETHRPCQSHPIAVMGVAGPDDPHPLWQPEVMSANKWVLHRAMLQTCGSFLHLARGQAVQPAIASQCACAPLQAGKQLVVLEIESSEQCDSGLAAEAELQWRGEQRQALNRCANLKHVFQRTARDCPDVTFLTLEVGFELPSLQGRVAGTCNRPLWCGDSRTLLWEP